MTLTSDAKFVIGILVATCLVIGVGAWVTQIKSKPAAANVVPANLVDRLARSDSAFQGPADAKVTVVEFGDFQCPACGSLYPAFKQAMQDNKDKSVRFVFRNYPLPQHQFAPLAAEASLYALAQNKFWEFHDILFEHQDNLTQADLENYAKQIGFNADDFKNALDNHTYKGIVDRDKADGVALGLDHTPTVYINDTEYTGNYSATELESAIDAALTK
ncbi:MAG: thioredoxin domain-containing protein [Candidatus Andersenbacteria bacterium]|nr:thioredoxin domain-containing protein [Candidatus Andersenbacteria bacterium]